MCSKSGLQTSMFASFVLLFAACAAALFAHVGIDVAGDMLLVRDAYDGLGHGSRCDVFGLIVTLAIGVALWVVWRALDEARTGRVASRATIDGFLGRTAWRFVLSVGVLAVPALAFMELLDIFCSGSHLDDIADLFGGSIPLGLAITLSIAALVATMVWFGVRSILSSHQKLVTVLGKLICLFVRACRNGGVRPSRQDSFNFNANRSCLDDPASAARPRSSRSNHRGAAVAVARGRAYRIARRSHRMGSVCHRYLHARSRAACGLCW